MGGKNNAFNQIGSGLGLVGSGGVFGGASSVGTGGSFKMTEGAKLGEQEALAALRAQASGQAPSVAEMQYKQALEQAQQAGMAQAASARGVNPALAFRAATQATQQAQAGAAGQSAMLAEEERRQAQQALLQAAAGQRGVALQGAQANLAAKNAYRGQTFDFLGNLGSSAAKASMGGAPKAGG